MVSGPRQRTVAYLGLMDEAGRLGVEQAAEPQLASPQRGLFLEGHTEPRFACDAMLGGLARWLRAAGHDASWHDGIADPDLVRLASNPREEVRSTDAWVMGQDTAGPGFHDALLKMLEDPSMIVRGNAALSLVSFGDRSGRPQIVSLLQPVTITAPTAGRVMDTAGVGTAIHQGGLIAKLQDGDGQQTRDLR